MARIINMGYLKGELFTGMGDGARYMSMDHYRRCIEDSAGFEPFPGTFNVRVDPDEARTLRETVEAERVDPEGDYIGMYVYPVRVDGLEAAYLDLDVTDHGEDVMEIVSPEYLRGRLELVDGDEVRIRY
ncbi:MAG: DUF120 domain-containing protein [Candidatus Aenigmatarchaeota archaeon]